MSRSWGPGIDKKGKEIVRKGERVYYKIKPELEKKFDLGFYVTIEVDTGRYFVGRTLLESAHKAKKEFPRKQFFSARVGRLADYML